MGRNKREGVKIEMPTYVAENVLCSESCGIVVVNAKDLDEAKELVIKKFDYYPKIADIISSLRGMEDKEVLYVWGHVEDSSW
ncbi:MAG: hypothetical protein QXL94_04305 [Candidatus Parvarchaeum sp.]